jgi:hypothetical protein
MAIDDALNGNKTSGGNSEGTEITLRYVLNGKVLSGPAATQRSALARCPVICMIAETEHTQEVHGFHDDDAFQQWARGQGFVAKLEETNELLAKAREYERRDHRRILERQQLLNQRTLEDWRELAQQEELEPTSRQLFDLAHRGLSVLEPPIIHSAVLYHTSPLGAAVFILPIGIPVPTFGGGNDRASIMDAAGVLTTLWDKTWWRGDRQHFYGIGRFTLANSGFDNRAASGVNV